MEFIKRIFGALAGAVAGFVVSVIFVMIAQGGIALDEVVGIWTILGAVIGGTLGFIFPEKFLDMLYEFFPF